MDQLQKYNPEIDVSGIVQFQTTDLDTPEGVFHLYKTLLQLIKMQEATFLAIGRALKMFRDKKLYKDLDYANFTQFLNSEEVSFSREKAYMYIRIYEYFIDWLEMDENRVAQMSISRLSMMLPILKKIDDKDEAIEKIKDYNSMRHNDFVQEVRKVKTGGKPNVYWSKEIDKWIVQYHSNITQLITLKDYEPQKETDD